MSPTAPGQLQDGEFQYQQQQQQQQQYTPEQYYAILQQQQASMHQQQQQAYNQAHHTIQPQQLPGTPAPTTNNTSRHGPTTSSSRSKNGVGAMKLEGNANNSTPAKQRQDSMDSSSNDRDAANSSLNKDGQPQKFSRSKGVSTYLMTHRHDT